MKRKIILFAMLLALTGMIAIQSCKKEAPVAFKEVQAAVPGAPVPANSEVIARTSGLQTITLTWTGAGTFEAKWDVYFGNTSSPEKVATGLAANTYDVQVDTGGLYYWQVKTIDANNVATESPVWEFDVNSIPSVPTAPVPDTGAVGVSCTPTLSWTATDPDGDALTFDLYLDKVNPPVAIAATGLESAEYAITAALSPNTLYYWKVVAHDPYGGVSVSPIWKFTTGALPIATFTGNYNADEPAESYSYPVSFTMVNTTTIKTTNYWNSSWTGVFTLDFTKLTYNMPLTTFATGWTGVESGIIDPANGKMTGTYTIWHNGVINEQGVHTYTKL
jgi:hypothetical protein